MEPYEANGIVTGCRNGQISEAKAAQILMSKGTREFLRIITNIPDPEHPSAGEKDPAKLDIAMRDPRFFKWTPVVEIEKKMEEKVIRIEGTNDVKIVQVPRYTAYGDYYDTPDGRHSRDLTTSGTEKMILREDGTVEYWGAATALLSRLLEAHACIVPEPEVEEPEVEE